MVDPIVGTKQLTKVLMDGGSGLNIMYVEMLDAMGINRARIRPTGAPFHVIMPRKQDMPLRQIDLPVTFRAIVASTELTALRKEVAKEAPDTKRSTRSFEPIEGSKEVPIDLGSSEGKVVHIGTTLSSK
ncbi:uncharacterized protein [Miscanthus floridulus]|uniref:uncharacterized protein n=1 Tax=Miscanthus floridulus TaxID=154761 RepID=UPI00345A23B3